MDNRFAKYASASPEDLIDDPDFRHWVLRGENQDFWQTFLVLHPERRPLVEEAIQMLRKLESDFPKAGLTPAEADALYAAIRRRIGEQEQKRPKPNPRKNKRRTLLPAAALAATILLLLGLLWWTWPAPERVYATGNGRQMRIYLPDSSLVELNANSRIAFSSRWKPARERVVKLQGEAFFTVRKQKQLPSVFTVETGPLRVQVLGTRFNVNSRRGHTAVALEEGSVKLALVDAPQAEAAQSLVMKPGEVVTYRPDSGLVSRSDVELEPLLSWRSGTLIFKRATLDQVAQRYEELYGRQVVFADDSLRGIEVQLSVPANDGGKFIKTLRILFEKSLEIRESDNRIYIQALR